MQRMSTVLVATLLLGSGAAANAQSRAVEDTYGKGVHAYFAGKSQEAFELFSRSLAAGSKDPRNYYFRGLAQIRMGQELEGEADFAEGARLEVSENSRATGISKALQRVQGAARRKLEKFRSDARLESATAIRERDLKRYGTSRRRALEKLEGKIANPEEIEAEPGAETESPATPPRGVKPNDAPPPPPPVEVDESEAAESESTETDDAAMPSDDAEPDAKDEATSAGVDALSEESTDESAELTSAAAAAAEAGAAKPADADPANPGDADANEDSTDAAPMEEDDAFSEDPTSEEPSKDASAAKPADAPAAKEDSSAKDSAEEEDTFADDESTEAPAAEETKPADAPAAKEDSPAKDGAADAEDAFADDEPSSDEAEPTESEDDSK